MWSAEVMNIPAVLCTSRIVTCEAPGAVVQSRHRQVAHLEVAGG